MTTDKCRTWLHSNSDIIALIAMPYLGWYLYTSSTWIGYLSGWLVGASKSSVTSVAMPLVFGLLAAIGIGVGSKVNFKSPLAIIWAGYIAFCVTAFCHHYDDGLRVGIEARENAAIATDAQQGVKHAEDSSKK